MAQEKEYVTVYRSADPSAADDAEAVCSMLVDAGLNAIILDDKAPGVVEGSCEVRVPGEQVPRAEELLSETLQGSPEGLPQGDPSHSMDEVIIFSAMGATAELEANAIHSILKVNDIPSYVVGTPVIPSLSFQVIVPQRYADQARQIIEEAEEAGPEAADLGEESSEHPEQ